MRPFTMTSFAESFYARAPVWLQNVGISLYGVYWQHHRLGGAFETVASRFREREAWEPDRLQEYLQKELRRTLVSAARHVPAYATGWQRQGIAVDDLARFRLTDLPSLPVLRKDELRAGPERFVSRDPHLLGRIRPYHSSGSTGTPVIMYSRSEDYRRFTAAREARSFRWAGVSLRFPRSMIGGRIVVPKGKARPPFHRLNLAERQLYFSAFHIAPGHVAHYVEAFNRHKPRVLTGYAHSHYTLARMMEEHGLALDYEPDAAILSSEGLTDPMREVIRRSLRTRPFEEYSAVENCLLATECEEGRLHVSPDFGIVEIVDRDGLPVPMGEEGSVVVTGLLNRTQPLIRYEIGDVGAWACEACPCGRNHLPTLKGIVGRLEDVVVGSDGREMVRFHGIFVDLEGVAEGQVIQEETARFRVKVVPTESFSEVDERKIRSRFHQRLGPVQVEIERVGEIPRTERGKFRAVVSKLGRKEGARP